MFAQDFDRAGFLCRQLVEDIFGQFAVVACACHRPVIVQRDEDVGFSLDVEEIVFHADL